MTRRLDALAEAELRGRLCALAVALGVAPADREDCVQDALVAAMRADPEAPAAYAAGVLRRLALMARRRAAAARRAAQGAADPAFVRHSAEATTLARAFEGESAARCLAALEQAILWGGAGRTSMVLALGASNAELEARALLELGFYLRLIAALPVSERHRRRCRARVESLIIEALPSVRIVSPSATQTRLPVLYLGDEPAPEPEPVPEPPGLALAAGLMPRGLRLLARLELSLDAEAAERLAFEVAAEWWVATESADPASW